METYFYEVIPELDLIDLLPRAQDRVLQGRRRQASASDWHNPSRDHVRDLTEIGFWRYLPFPSAARDPVPLPLPVSGPTILVVDDTPAVREVVRRSLEYAGYRVCEAGDGEEALALLALSPVDLVISDLRMPRIDGRTLALEMRRRSLGIPL